MRKTQKKDKTLIGNLRLSFKGTGYIKNTEKIGEDIEIRFENLNTATNGDTVKVLITGTGKGKVLEIIKRSKRGFSGEIKKDKHGFYLKPSDAKMYSPIELPKENLMGAKIGDKVFVTILKWSQGKMPLGKVSKILGKVGEHEAEMQGIILERGFDSSFPENIEREALKLKNNKISDSEIKKRKDLRKITTFTIDPDDAKDFDDALSFREIKKGVYEIGIHIADVSYYVRPNSVLDKEALERATSVYLVDRTIPMLPEVLSNDLCSLNPREDKLCFSAVFEIDINGQITREWFGRTIINSDKRFTYEEAQEILDKGNGLFFEELNILNTIAKKLNEQRIASGAITMETEEVKFKLDDQGKPISVKIKKRGDTNKLIEEFMLLANKRVAMYGSKDDLKKERVFIYRIHNEPDKAKIKDLREYLKLLGYSLNERRGSIPPEEFNRLFKELEGKNEKDTVQSVVIRSMQKAIYSTKNLGHYGLAFPFYTHFTSPIRRYPDIIAHRLMEDYLNGRQIVKEKASFYEKMAIHCTEREIEAAEAERSSVKYKQVEYMSSKIGEEFDGIVTGINEWVVYVSEKTTHTEGIIKIRDFFDGSYTYDVKKMMLVSKNSSKIIRIGEEIKIKVKSVDVERQNIEYQSVANDKK